MGMYLPNNLITKEERQKIVTFKKELAKVEPEAPLYTCAPTAQFIREILGWKTLTIRCKLQQQLNDIYRSHTINLHPPTNKYSDGFLVDGTLEQFDYKKYKYLMGSKKRPPQKQFLPFIENGIPQIAILPRSTPIFEPDEKKDKQIKNAPIDGEVKLILHQLYPKKYCYPF